MERTANNTRMHLAALVPLSTFSKYLIPFGNFIFPIILWAISKKDQLVEDHARRTLNFQISLFLYAVLILVTAFSVVLLLALSAEVDIYMPEDFLSTARTNSIAIPIFIVLAITGFLLLALFILELIAVLSASMNAYHQKSYKYPLTIPFINSSSQSKNEQNNNPKNESL